MNTITIEQYFAEFGELLAQLERGQCPGCGDALAPHRLGCGSDGHPKLECLSGAPVDPEFWYEVNSHMQFLQTQYCDECGNDLDQHVFTPDMFGHAHVTCIPTPVINA